MVKVVMLAVLAVAVIFSHPAAAQPIGYPWSTWGEVAGIKGNQEFDGLRMDGYIEQGIDWTRIGRTKWVLNTFVGLRFGANTYHDNYGNRVGPWFGVKAKYDFQPKTGWGAISIGIRGESNYHPNRLGNELVGAAFIQWSAGGDHKK